MGIDQLGQDWTRFREQLKCLRALVVDDEKLIARLLAELLTDQGFEVDTAPDAEVAWECIGNGPYDLLVVDKNLPGQSGVDLIAQVHKAEIDLPSVMITGFASVESISEAFGHGAADYIAKPFPDVRQVVHRLKSVADRRVAARLYERIIHDLREVAVARRGEEAFEIVASALYAARMALAEHPDVLVAMPSPRGDYAVAGAALRKPLRIEVARDTTAATEQLSAERPPLVLVLSLDLADALTFIESARRNYPLLEILALSDKPDLSRSLEAIGAGAADFVWVREEGTDALLGRAARLVEVAKIQRLHLALTQTLYARLSDPDHPVAKTLLETLPPEQRVLVDPRHGEGS